MYNVYKLGSDLGGCKLKGFKLTRVYCICLFGCLFVFTSIFYELILVFLTLSPP